MKINYKWKKEYIIQLFKDSDYFCGKQVVPIIGPHPKSHWDYPGSCSGNRNKICVKNRKERTNKVKGHCDGSLWIKLENGLWKKIGFGFILK